MSDWAGSPATLALQALPSAIIIYDARHRLVMANQRMLALAGVDQRWLAPNTALADVLRLFTLRGLYGPGDPASQLAELTRLDRTKPSRRMIRLGDGTTLEARVQPMADGGFIDCFSDVTAFTGPLETAMEDLRRLETVFSQLSLGVAVFRDDQLLLHNPAYPRLTGLPAAQVRPGLTVLELNDRLVERGEFTPEERAAWLAARARREPGKRASMERRRPNGTRLHVDINPLPDSTTLYEFSDVTAERRAQEEAQRRALLLDTVLAALPVGVVVWGADRRARLVNAAYNAIMTGSNVTVGDEMVTVLRARAQAGEYGPGDPEEKVRQILDGMHQPNAFLRRRPDGRIVAFRPEPLRDGGQVVVVTDVTALHEAQAEATARAETLRTMLDGMRHGIALFDDDGRVVTANRLAAAMCGVPAEVFVPGASLADLRRAQIAAGEFGDAAQTAAFITARLPEPEHAPARYTRTRPDGSVIEIRTDPVVGGGFVRTYSDITELRRAETQLTTMLEGMRHGVALFRPDGTLVAVNSLTRKLTGLPDPVYAPGTQIAGILTDVARAEHIDTPAERETFLEHAGARGLKAGRYIRRTTAGRVLEVVTDQLADGSFVRTISDVTALHEAEARAKARAGMLQTMLDSIRHGLVMYDRDKRLIAANRLASQLTGVADLHRRNDLRMADVLAVQKAAGSFGHGDAADAVERWFLELDRSKPHAFQRHAPDGRVLEIVSDPTQGGGFVVTISDVSKLLAAEDEARRRAEVLGVMLENIRHGICMFDAEGRVVAANRLYREMLDLPAELVQPGRRHVEIVSEMLAQGEFGQGEAAAAAAAERLSADPRQPARYVRSRPNGLTLEVVRDPIPDGGFVLTYTDITESRLVRNELEQARDAAETANAAKSRFLATMSHELRTPLTAVIGFAEALQTHPDAPARADYLQSIRDAGKHLLSLINDILDVARAEQGSIAVQEEAVAVAELMEGVARVMRVTADSNEVTLLVDLPTALPAVRADALRLRQVLLNLVSNAVKFTPAGGHVRLWAAREPSGALLLRVTDTGMGMAAEDIPRAFQPFNQLDGGLTRRFAGSGLGLHLSRTLAEAQGAELSLTSALGQGTTATIRIPPDRLFQPMPATESHAT
jgi:signal transduction histidine kinase